MPEIKITKRINRKVGDEVYWKYSINIPNGTMDELDWTEKTPVKMNVKGKKLVIERE